MALTDNIISYWKMDGNANDAVSTNNGTATSVTFSTANGKINEGAGGMTTSSKIEVPSASDLNPTSALTISCWVNVTSTTNQYHTFFAKGNVAQYIFRIEGPTGKIELYLKIGGVLRNVRAPSALTTGSWQFISATYDGSAMKLYTNGSEVASASFSGSIGTGTAVLGIGHDITDNGSNVHLIGAIDEVGMWSRALTSGEISTLYNGGSGLQYPFGSSTQISFINGVAQASISSFNGVALASIASAVGVANS